MKIEEFLADSLAVMLFFIVVLLLGVELTGGFDVAPPVAEVVCHAG
jgi:hypothetical protein